MIDIAGAHTQGIRTCVRQGEKATATCIHDMEGPK